MKCPWCDAAVPEDSTRCPACNGKVAVSNVSTIFFVPASGAPRKISLLRLFLFWLRSLLRR